AHDRVKRLRAPDSVRLSEATALLKSEGFAREADALAQAAYERQLALNQVTMPALAELARLAWARNDAAAARQWLALLVKLGDAATRATALAELAALAAIKARVVADPLIATPEESFEVPLADALRLAAEYSATYGQYDEALGYRQRLLALHPADESTRLEMARLLIAKSQPQAAGEALAAVLTDRQSLRAARWQAMWLADELETNRGALWQTLWARWQAGALRDAEMQQALAALAKGERVSGATGSAVFQLWQANGALPPLIEASVKDVSANAAWIVPELRWALIRSYAAQQQAGAALRLSDRDTRLNGAAVDLVALREAVPPEAEVKVTGLMALPLRVERARAAERVAALRALSQMAEQVEAFDRAANYEAARLALTADVAERAAALQRIEAMLARAKQRKEAAVLRYAINERPLS
ncbi:MAG: tetratricopeptide repeat protein, partial [Acidobacteria bacterium]|nr:tetratricopeptide repeat protein [Acidobacteriota bacterium]